ncbi:MAG: ribose transport system permease protein [Saprospiraceae bacterium]|jgi:ribose/xylose/arabinose/galactoside ABC-type transport system permease subunit|tara:strand:- start:1083 stop:2105 length:1023 start_codon:yes stop_codon:yes gene_type:complete
MSAAADSKRSASFRQSTALAILKQNGLNIFLAIIALVFIGFAITTHNYLTLFNIKTIVRDAALVGIMGIGLTFVTLSGNFFLLSMKETAALCIITFATSMSHDYGFIISLVGALAVAMVSGGLQGLLIGRGGNPIVVTLGAAGILYGIASWWSDNLVISFRRPNDAEWLGTGSVMGIPNITITFIVIAILAELVLRKTSFGRQVYLIGANRAAGKATGHENRSMAIKVCMIASVCCAIVAVAFSAQMSSAQANYFSSEFGSSGDFTILVIATVMVAGNSIMGGYGSTLRTSLGAVFISAVDNMMVLQGYNSGPRVLSVGLMIVFSILVFAYIRRDNRSEG